MKIYTKILLVTLPLALLSLLSGAGGTYYLSKQALEHIADNWLQTRLGEAVKTVAENEEFLRRYSITDISSGVKKAQYDAGMMLQSIKVGKLGYVFVVGADGTLLVHPDASQIGTDLSGQEWFATMSSQPTGRLDYNWNRLRNLAAYEYFPPWGWYVIVTDPFSEIYGGINRTRDLVVSLAIFGSVLMVLLIIFLARRITAPLRLLVDGAQKIGRGDLQARVPVNRRDEFGELSAAFNVMSTQLQKSHGALRQSEQHFRSLIENDSGLILLLEGNGITRYLSPSLQRVLGYRSEQLLGKPLTGIVHPDDLTLFSEFLDLSPDAQPKNRTAEFRLQHADGNWRLFEIISENLIDTPAVSGIVLNARDITVRKQVEEALRHSEERLKALMSQLLQGQEGERKRLASELHDVVGQNLLFLKLKIAQLDKGLQDDQARERTLCEETLDYVDQTIENVRRLCWDLLPSALEDLGLTAAITTLLEDFAKHYEVDIDVNFEKIDDALSEKAQVLVYRLFQESLTNIGKHAQATRVTIEASRHDGHIHFRIDDNGRGFDYDQNTHSDAARKTRGMGLSTMRERARILGAKFEVQSVLGGGTAILFSIPDDEGED